MRTLFQVRYVPRLEIPHLLVQEFDLLLHSSGEKRGPWRAFVPLRNGIPGPQRCPLPQLPRLLPRPHEWGSTTTACEGGRWGEVGQRRRRSRTMHLVPQSLLTLSERLQLEKRAPDLALPPHVHFCGLHLELTGLGRRHQLPFMFRVIEALRGLRAFPLGILSPHIRAGRPRLCISPELLCALRPVLGFLRALLSLPAPPQRILCTLLSLSFVTFSIAAPLLSILLAPLSVIYFYLKL